METKSKKKGGLATRIIRLAWRDAEFREELARDPAAAIQRHLGVKVPAGVTVRVHFDTDAERNFVVPKNPNAGASPRPVGVADDTEEEGCAPPEETNDGWCSDTEEEGC